MMVWILLATLCAGVGSVLLAALLSRWLMAQFQAHMLSLAAGALLATALLHLMPEALNTDKSAHQLFALLLAGLVFFFLLDKAELWHHGHEHGHGQGRAHHAHHDHHDHEHSHDHGHAHDHDHDHDHGKSGGWSVLLADSLHCFGDGILIAGAFVADPRLGVAATLAVLAHEVPHHIGDLAVLMQSSRNSAQAVAKVSAAGGVTVLGGIVGYLFASTLADHLPYLLVIGSSSFIYVALADLIPQLQKRLSARETAAQIAWLALGIAMVAAATSLSHG
jgi:zinc and cadmium transporter